MFRNDMIPRFIDLPYLEPMVDVLRLTELKFSLYPQAPQLYEINHCYYQLTRKQMGNV